MKMYKSKKYKEYKETLSKTDVYDEEFLRPFKYWVEGYEEAMAQLKIIADTKSVSENTSVVDFGLSETTASYRFRRMKWKVLKKK